MHVSCTIWSFEIYVLCRMYCRVYLINTYVTLHSRLCGENTDSFSVSVCIGVLLIVQSLLYNRSPALFFNWKCVFFDHIFSDLLPCICIVKCLMLKKFFCVLSKLVNFSLLVPKVVNYIQWFSNIKP